LPAIVQIGMNDGPYMVWAEDNTFTCLVKDMVALMLEKESDGSSAVVTSKRVSFSILSRRPLVE